MSLSIQGQKHIRAAIIRLLLWGGPLAISFAIALVVVLSVNGKALEVSWKHVVNEPIKIKPFIADGNSSFAVILEKSIALTIASQMHVSPHNIKRVFYHVLHAVNVIPYHVIAMENMLCIASFHSCPAPTR